MSRDRFAESHCATATRRATRVSSATTFRVRNVVEQERGGGGVEGVVSERQLLSIAECELDPGVEPAGTREHLIGEIDADCARSARGRGSGDMARAVATSRIDVPWWTADGLEQRLRYARRDAADDGVVCIPRPRTP